MKTNEMTPEWVVENFLPDYNQRIEADFFRTDEAGYPKNFVPRESWSIEESCPWQEYFDETKEEYEDSFRFANFPEALAELLKAQREVCAYEADIECVDWEHYIIDKDSILDASIPEPKNK